MSARLKRTVDGCTGIYVTTADGKGDPKPIWTSSPGSQNAPAWTTR